MVLGLITELVAILLPLVLTVAEVALLYYGLVSLLALAIKACMAIANSRWYKTIKLLMRLANGDVQVIVVTEGIDDSVGWESCGTYDGRQDATTKGMLDRAERNNLLFDGRPAVIIKTDEVESDILKRAG